MGTQFLAGLMGGLSSGIAQNRQRQVEEDYRKALIEQSKLQTKVLENKLALANQEQGLMKAYLQTKGIQLPPPAAPLQVSQQPQTQPQGLLGRIFNPNPPAPTPAATPAATQSPLPQMIAQGQMQGQLGQGQPAPNQAFMEDLMNKRLFDMPPWREKFAEESKQVGRVITTMTPNGPMSLVIDKSGKPMQGFQPPPEYKTTPMTGPQGEQYLYSYPAHQPPGVNAPGLRGQSGTGIIQIQPPAGTVPSGKISEEGEKKIREAQGFLDSINKLREYTKDPKDANLFGYISTQQHQMYQDPDSLKSAVGREIMERTIGPPSPRLTQFRARLEALNSAIRYQLYAGNLAEREAAFYTRQAASATTQPQLKAILDQMEDDFKIKMENIRSQAMTPPVRQGLPSKPQLPNQMPPPPEGWKATGEKSSDGYPIVTDGKVKKRWGP